MCEHCDDKQQQRAKVEAKLAKELVLEVQALANGEIPPRLDGMPTDLDARYSYIAVAAGMIVSLLRGEPLPFVMGEFAGLALEADMSVMFKRAAENG
jgi:hypothetical protein